MCKSCLMKKNRMIYSRQKNIFRKNKNGQSVLDYVVFLVIIIATLLIMGYYIRNRLAGSHREAADTFGGGEVYVPDVEGVSNPSCPNPPGCVTYEPPMGVHGTPVTEPSRMW